MSLDILIYVAGAIQLASGLVHIGLSKTLDQEEAIPDELFRITLLIFSKLLLVFYFGTAFICFFYTEELRTTSLGSAVLVFLFFYWLIRAMLQVQYFGFKRANDLKEMLPSGGMSNQVFSTILFVVFLLSCLPFIIPVIVHYGSN